MNTLLRLLTVSLLTVISSGCATHQPSGLAYHTESHSAGGVKILSVGLLADANGLLVHGTVERQTGYYGTPFRHLDLEVRGPAGEQLTKAPIKFFPNPIAHARTVAGRATYTFRLATLPPPNSTIRVSVDFSLLEECKQAIAAK